MLNKVLLIGRLVKDPQLVYLPSGDKVLNLVVVYNNVRKVNDEFKEEPYFFNVSAYGKAVDTLTSLTSLLNKGDMVLVEGKLVQDRWTDKEGKNRTTVRISAQRIRLVQKPKQEQEQEKTEEERVEKEQDVFTEEDELSF